MANKGPRRLGPNGRAPSKPDFAFGTDEEVAARSQDRRMGTEEVRPANFRQIKPSMAGGGILRAPWTKLLRATPQGFQALLPATAQSPQGNS